MERKKSMPRMIEQERIEIVKIFYVYSSISPSIEEEVGDEKTLKTTTQTKIGRK